MSNGYSATPGIAEEMSPVVGDPGHLPPDADCYRCGYDLVAAPVVADIGARGDITLFHPWCADGVARRLATDALAARAFAIQVEACDRRRQLRVVGGRRP